MDERDAAFLCAFLAERDQACPACGYNLRGLRSSRCPECSQELTVRVALAEPALGAYVASLAGLAVGAGSPVLLIVGVLLLSMELGFPQDEDIFVLFVCPAVMFMYMAGLLVWLAVPRGRRWFLARSAGRRWIVAACWTLTLGAFGLWMLLLFYVN